MITRVRNTPTNGQLLTRITGKPTAGAAGLRAAILQAHPVYLIAHRVLIGTGVAVDRDGHARIRTVRGEHEVITRRRIFLVPRDHPWRVTDPA